VKILEFEWNSKKYYIIERLRFSVINKRY